MSFITKASNVADKAGDVLSTSAVVIEDVSITLYESFIDSYSQKREAAKAARIARRVARGGPATTSDVDVLDIITA